MTGTSRHRPEFTNAGTTMMAPTSNRTIHVVFASDARYAMPLAAALYSLVANLKSHAVHVHIIQSGITADLREKIVGPLSRTAHPTVQVDWLDAPVDRLTTFKLAHAYTTALTFARLLIPELLPDSVDRAIYLDCDLIVDGDIGPLWERNFEDRALLAVRDPTGVVSAPDGLANYRELGVPADAHYFNAGVLVLNLEKWRRDDIAAKVLTYLSTHADLIQMADQEALNAVLWNDWIEIGSEWNWQICHRDIRRGHAPAAWRPDSDAKHIVHFTTGEKPWLPGCDYAEKVYFYKYLDHTAWAGKRVPWQREAAARVKQALHDLKHVMLPSPLRDQR